jgi:PAS domain S-box-containing protein
MPLAGPGAEIRTRPAAPDAVCDLAAMARLGRLYLLLTRINEAVARGGDPAKVCAAVCTILVREGGTRSVVVRIQDRIRATLVPLASSGPTRGWVGGRSVELASAQAHSARAGRERRTVLIQDLETETLPPGAIEDARAVGVRSSVAIPLLDEGELIGVMTLYAGAHDHFDPELMRMLEQAGASVATLFVRKRAARQRAESEARYGEMLAALPSAVRVIQDGKVVMANPAAQRLLGASSVAELLGCDPLQHIVQEDRERVRQRLREARLTGKTMELARMRLLRADGTLCEIESTVVPCSYEGRPAVMAMARDITAQVRAELRLKREHDLYVALSKTNEAVLRAASEDDVCHAVCEIAVRHGGLVAAAIRRYNPRTRRLEHHCGFGRLHGMLGLAAIDLDDAASNAARTAREGSWYVCNDIATDPNALSSREDGARIGVRASAGFAMQVHGEMVGVMSVFAAEAGFFDDDLLKLLREMAGNVSVALEKLQSQQALESSEQRYRALFEASPVAIRVVQGDKIALLNRAALALLGYGDMREARELPVLETVAPAWREQVRARLARVQSEGVVAAPMEMDLLRRDGGHVEVEVSSLQIDFEGRPAALSIIRDLTERNAAARRLQRVSNFYIALSHTNEAIFREPDLQALCSRVCELAVRHGGLVSAAVRMVDSTGLKLLPFAGSGPLRGWIGGGEVRLDDPRSRAALCVQENRPYFSDDIFTDPTVAVARDDARAVGVRSSGGLPLAVDGRVVGLFSVYAAEPAYFDEESARLVGVMARNLAFAFERRQQADELARSSEHYRLLFESSPDAMRVACDGKVVLLNPAGVRLFGLSSAKQMLGLPVEKFIPAQYRELSLARVRTVIEERKPVPLSRQQVCRPDGTCVDVEVITLPFVYEGRPAALSIVHDISERKAAESMARRMHAQLEERVAQRTEELHRVNEQLEAFSYTVAHDLRAPLRRISGFAGLLREQLGPRLADEDAQLLARLVDGAAQMNSLIDGLLEVAHAGNAVIHARHVSLTALAAEAAAALAARDPGREVEIRIEPGMQAWADAQLLRDVMDNLLGNAWKFTSKVAVPVIQVGTLPDGAAAGAPGSVAGHQVFYVRDNGAGFDPHYAAKLFGTFQRLHTQHEFPGNGIGLASVAAVIRHHGGRVWARGKPGEGATFFFSLPAGGEAPADLAVAT